MKTSSSDGRRRARPPDAAGLAARRAALDMVASALSRRGGIEEALARPAFVGLPAADRGFARALGLTTLRRLGPIDRLLDAKLAREPPPPVRHLLRLGLAQAFWLQTPDFAAVDTAVALAPKPLRGLVNAVLRGALRDGPPPEAAEALAPPWLFARWRGAFGEAAALAIAAEIAKEPATDLTLRDLADAEMAAALEGEALGAGTVRVRGSGDVATWPGYAEGRWWVQDAAAAVPARLLAVGPGKRVLDLCAAPGGKSLQLAAAGAHVTAVDKSAARLRRLAAGLKRTGLAAEIVALDVESWTDPRRFEAVLLDAPCSSTGAFRRHPEVLWNARPADIASLAEVQARLIASAAKRLIAGGRLVYSVCSLEPEEGEAQIRRFLDDRPHFALDPIAAGEGGAPEASRCAEGWLRILPHHREGGADGFFIARLIRSR